MEPTERNKNIDSALAGASELLKQTNRSTHSKWRSLCCVAAMGGVLTATGCASAPTTPDQDPNYQVRTSQAATTYAMAGFAVSALLGGNTSQNIQRTAGAAIAGGLIAFFDNRDDQRLRNELAEHGVELYTVTDTRNYSRTGVIHAHIPTKIEVGAGVEKNLNFFRALYDSAAYLPVMLEKFDRNEVRDISVVYTMPGDNGMFANCDVDVMMQTLTDSREWLNNHLKDLNSNLRVRNARLATSPSGETDRERLYHNILRGDDPGPSKELQVNPDAQCNEAEAAVLITYR